MDHNYTSKRTLIQGMSRQVERARRIGLLSIIVLVLTGSQFAQRREAQRVERVQRETALQIEPAQPRGYTTIYYKSGRLKIEAYLYKPQKGEAPFPLVIYNHG